MKIIAINRMIIRLLSFFINLVNIKNSFFSEKLFYITFNDQFATRIQRSY